MYVHRLAELSILEIHNQGYIHFTPSMRCMGDSTNYYDNYDPYLKSYTKLENLTKDLGYQRIEQLYYAVPGLSL